jgi:MFS family permease
MTTTTINAAQALSLATLVATGQSQLWQLYIFAAVGGVANSITQPVRQAFVYDAVGREAVARAVPINNMANTGTRALGPVFAGMIIGFVGSSSAFYVQGALALLAMILTSRIGITGQVRTAAGRESPLTTLTQGLRYVAGTQALREQVLIQVVPVLFLYPYVQFLAFFAVHLHGGPQTYGVLATGAGYGGIIALVILTTMGEIRRKGLVLLASVCVYPVSVACFALSPNLPVAMVFLVINGFCNQIYMTMQSTLFLLSAREDMRGRVMGMYSMLNGLGPIGQLGLGLAISVWGPPNAILAFALTAAALLFVAAWTAKTVRAA